MPLLSAFTPLGHLTLSSKTSHGQRFFEAMVAALGGQYSLEEGSRMRGHLYAQAMGHARSKYTLERAGDQADPHRVYEHLATREGEYGLVPTPGEIIPERRAALASRMLLPLGAARVNVENALRELLGDAFVAYRPTPFAEAVVAPAALGDQPQNLQLPTVPRKLVRIRDAITTGFGAPQEVTYDDLLADPAADTISAVPILLVGDRVVVGPEDSGTVETVEVTASRVFVISEVEYELRITATFNQPHAAGCLATTMPYPAWASTKRHNLVVLTAEGAADAETRRKTDDLLGRILRGVSTWDIAGETTPGFAGPFTVGGGLLGITTIGEIEL